jgi:DNA-binding response OmpR family regulator
MVIHQERKAEYERHAARLLELDRQELEILSERERKTDRDVPLGFDVETKTIYWDGGSIHLGGIPFTIVKMLYEAPKRRALLARIEKRAWRGKKWCSGNTVHVTFYQLHKNLLAVNFPYKIESVKCIKPVVVYDMQTQGKAKVDHIGEIMGYRLCRR